MSTKIAGPASAALAALTPAQLAFIRGLPKAELHAHLNGSIPLPVLQELAREHLAAAPIGATSEASFRVALEALETGVVLEEISDFFGLFPAIYKLTSTAPALARVTRAVLLQFLAPGADGAPECTYLELRTGPRVTPHLMRREYLEAVLDEVERYPPDRASLIVSLDRPMRGADLAEVVGLAIDLKREGRRVVGVDLCGDPLAGDIAEICKHVRVAKDAGLSVTLHIAETSQNPAEETRALLATQPDRLGHATFLDADARAVVTQGRMCVEICLSSNLLCKTVASLEDHHIRHYLAHNHPIAICTDDTLPFRTSLTGEYALLLAPLPLGLGLSENEVRRIAGYSMRAGFSASS